MGSEKELNVHLLDLLDLCEDTLDLIPDKESPAAKFLLKQKKHIERKLYQTPPLMDDNQK